MKYLWLLAVWAYVTVFPQTRCQHCGSKKHHPEACAWRDCQCLWNERNGGEGDCPVHDGLKNITG